MEFNHRETEAKWKKKWKEEQTYKVDNEFSKPKYYVLDMFPYPSGAGLHVGHPLGYIASDIVARFKKMKGFNVLHPMGFDAFGLPAEQYAIQTGIHPIKSTTDNINRYREQLINIGLNFDWNREVNTSDISYYRWTQWIFLKLYSHYYDNKVRAAKKIEDLISHFNQFGNSNLHAASNQDFTFTSEQWKNYSLKEQDEILMNYRLAYRKQAYVNWCEALGTVLANDEIKDGVSERGGHPVEKRPMLQWALRITAYAERLLEDLDSVEWSDALKNMQRNWIGKSTGARIFFPIQDHADKLEVFTTRPDTIFGAAFIVLAPEHPLIPLIVSNENKTEVTAYLNYTQKRSERERQSETRKVTGVFSGVYALHPITNKQLPIWISDYVLIEYGSGAIMAVPGHDKRDQLFARQFNLPIIQVVDQSNTTNADIEDKDGRMINSEFLDGLTVTDAIKEIIEIIDAQKFGQALVQYRMRDANFSRQRYWGEPFPIYYNKEGVSFAMKESELPLQLPYIENIQTSKNGNAPLFEATDWKNWNGFNREIDTMPGYAGSSWYFLRYMDVNNEEAFASTDALNYWRDVDLYIGGTEHAVGHLMYSRFWHKFLYDLGYVPTVEPFRRLVNQGMIQGVIESIYLLKETQPSHFIDESLTDKYGEDNLAKIPVHIDFITDYNTPESHMNKSGLTQFINWRPEFKEAIFENSEGFSTIEDMNDNFRIHTYSEVGKMSKRYHNVVNPDDVIDKYGADCFRMYEMFLGPVEQSKPWDTKGIDGVSKFLRKFYSLYFNEEDIFILQDEIPSPEELKILHTCIKKVNADIEDLSFNTSVSAFMICVNELKRLACKKKLILLPLAQLLAPFAPFITEEIWSKAKMNGSIHHSEYPLHSEEYLINENVNYPVSINGKKRYEWIVSKTIEKGELEIQVLKLDEIKKWIEGQQIKKIIVVKDRMINIVI
jgi:leucyl-tRNA synthetase